MSESSSLLEVSTLAVRVGREQNLVVKGVSLEVRAGERIALLGPSGCGKTTTLRAIAGFERADGGRISLAGQVLSEVGRHTPPHLRGVGMVFQDFALFPHLTVEENVTFGLDRLPKPERKRRADELMSLVGLEGLSLRVPGELSGGQQQRVALARALAPNPKLMLLDEPFSSLDAGLRASTRGHTERVLASVGAAALLVTHDQEEAMAFAQRIVLMNAGRVEQIGAPEELYRAPQNAFVASFLGTANLVAGQAQGSRAQTLLGEALLSRPANGTVMLCVRPEGIRVVSEAAFKARVRSREFRGATCLLTLERDGLVLSALVPGDAPWRVGDTAGLALAGPVAVLAGASSV